MPKISAPPCRDAVFDQQNRPLLGNNASSSISSKVEAPEPPIISSMNNWWQPRGAVPQIPSLELVPSKARPSRPMPPLFLFTWFPQSRAEEELIGSLLAVRGIIPSQEFFERLFAGLPHKPKHDAQASELTVKLMLLLRNIELKSWYHNMEQLDFAMAISQLLKLILEAHKLQAHSIDVFTLLQESLSAIIGVTNSPQALVARLQAVRICSHPDKFSQGLARFAAENNRLRPRVEIVFKALGQLLDLVQQDPKFAERLCSKPVRFHIATQELRGLLAATAALIAAVTIGCYGKKLSH